MASTEDVVLPLPEHLVTKSHGFALDIGGSVAKVFYRSKDEYEAGKPKPNKEGKGGVHMVNFPRDDVDDVIKILKEKCDITRDERGLADIFTTGFGGNLYRKKLEKELNVKIHNESEFALFSLAFSMMSKYMSEDELFLPLNESVLRMVEMKLNKLAAAFKRKMVLGQENQSVPESYKLPENPDDYFPCILVLAGSGTPFLVVDKEGEFLLTDFPCLGGRFMLGFSRMCCDVQSFGEMEELIANSDEGATCDAYTHELVEQQGKGQKQEGDEEGDQYSALSRGSETTEGGKHKSYRVFPFGKATMPGFKGATKGDMLYSMQQSVAEIIAQTAFFATYRAGVKTVFFAGNFVSTPRVRDFMTEQFHIQNLKVEPSERRNFRFIKNGGHLGAIGGYLFEKKQ